MGFIGPEIYWNFVELKWIQLKLDSIVSYLILASQPGFVPSFFYLVSFADRGAFHGRCAPIPFTEFHRFGVEITGFLPSNRWLYFCGAGTEFYTVYRSATFYYGSDQTRKRILPSFSRFFLFLWRCMETVHLVLFLPSFSWFLGTVLNDVSCHQEWTPIESFRVGFPVIWRLSIWFSWRPLPDFTGLYWVYMAPRGCLFFFCWSLGRLSHWPSPATNGGGSFLIGGRWDGRAAFAQSAPPHWRRSKSRPPVAHWKGSSIRKNKNKKEKLTLKCLELEQASNSVRSKPSKTR